MEPVNHFGRVNSLPPSTLPRTKQCSPKRRRCPKPCPPRPLPEKCILTKELETLRNIQPNQPENLGTSSQPCGIPYANWLQPAGNDLATNNKFEFNECTNKWSIPAFDTTIEFDLCPAAEECTPEQNQEIRRAGYERNPDLTPARSGSVNYYGLTIDEENFYYATYFGSFFLTYFGVGTSSLFVARNKKTGKLLWVKGYDNYRIDIPGQPGLFGSPYFIARTTLTVFKDRLYALANVTNIGPQLFCLNKHTGQPIWSMAYYLPGPVAAMTPGGRQGFIFRRANELGTYDGLLGLSVPSEISSSEGGIMLAVKELTPGVPSIFAGVASFQNSFNFTDFFTWPEYNDQGELLRIDDLGQDVDLRWRQRSCALRLTAGDIVGNSAFSQQRTEYDPEYDPFLPGSDQTVWWRETVEGDVRLSSLPATPVDRAREAKVIDYNTEYPGYRPFEIAPNSDNNRTVPVGAVFNYANQPVTQASFQNVFRAAAPGVGGDVRVYINATQAPLFPEPPVVAKLQDIVDWLNFTPPAPGSPFAPPYPPPPTFPLPDGTPSIKYTLWTYLREDEVAAIDSAIDGGNLEYMTGLRYAVRVSPGYQLQNEQEAKAFNYYGNSFWAKAPVIDLERNLVHAITGQAHASPLEETFIFQDPVREYYGQKAKVVNTLYEYTGDNVPTPPSATLEDVNTSKDTFAAFTRNVTSDFSLRSPRGNRSYSDAIVGFDLDTGRFVYGVRSVGWDTGNFIFDEPSQLIIRTGGLLDADMSGGAHLFENKTLEDGRSGQTLVCGQGKGSLFMRINITGLRKNTEFTHTNLQEIGVEYDLSYTGPDSILGGANYTSANSCGDLLVFCNMNFSILGFSQSTKYFNNQFFGFEFPVLQNGSTLQVQASYMLAFDVTKKKIAWETSMGNLGTPGASAYNGVAFAITSTGQLYGMNMKSGEIEWRLDGPTVGSLGGSFPPQFDEGRMYWCVSYGRPTNSQGTSNRGIICDVVKKDVLCLGDTLESLTRHTTFNSFESLPRNYDFQFNPVTLTAIELPPADQIKHEWGKNGELRATHQVTGVGSVVVQTRGTALDVPTKTSGFDTLTTQPPGVGVRYLGIKWLSKIRYLLRYQLYDSNTLQWINREAVLSTFEGDSHLTTPPPSRSQVSKEDFESIRDDMMQNLYTPKPGSVKNYCITRGRNL